MFLKGVIKSLIGLSLPGDRPYLKGDPAATRLLGDIISFVSTSTYLNGDPYLRGRSYGPTGGPTYGPILTTLVSESECLLLSTNLTVLLELCCSVNCWLLLIFDADFVLKGESPPYFFLLDLYRLRLLLEALLYGLLLSLRGAVLSAMLLEFLLLLTTLFNEKGFLLLKGWFVLTGLNNSQNS